MTTEHTPTPWDCDKDDLGIWLNWSGEPTPIASMGKSIRHNAEANAAFIVRAVNAYEALEDALLTALPFVEDCEDDETYKDKGASVRKAVAKIRAALTLARGKAD